MTTVVLDLERPPKEIPLMESFSKTMKTTKLLKRNKYLGVSQGFPGGKAKLLSKIEQSNYK